MAQQSIENFWNICEEQLKLYTNKFNKTMSPKGFKVKYKILDKNPIGIIILTHYDLPTIQVKSRGWSS